MSSTDFLVLSRASAAAADVDSAELTERHWSYMDRFADGMTARGPLLDLASESWLGSMHVVALPSFEAARSFVADEPYQRAGLFESHRILAFRNLLGRTMWEYAGAPDGRRFVALGSGPVAVPAEQLIVHGTLSDPATGAPAGFLACAQAPSREALDEWLGGLDAEVYDWEFGGRR